MKNVILGILLCALSAAAEVTLLESRSDGEVRLQFTNEDYRIDDTVINGTKYSSIRSSLGPAVTLEKGMPQVPVTAQALAVHSSNVPEVIVEDVEYEHVPAAPVLPSKGNINRNMNPDTIALTFASFYEKDAWYPGDHAVAQTPYVLHGARGASLRLFPFQYNPAEKTIRVVRSMVLRVETGSAPSPAAAMETTKKSPAFQRILNDRFLNRAPAPAPTTSRYTPVRDGDRMVVIAPQEYASAMEPFITWKNQKGIETSLHIYGSDMEASVRGVKAFLEQEYAQGLTYALIVGDFEDIPSNIENYVSGGTSEDVSADPYYSFLDGNDLYADIFVGRLSAESAAGVENYVAKVLAYEKYPDLSDSWHSRTVGIGSNEGTPADYDWIADSIFTELENYGYERPDQIFQGYGGTEQDFSGYINEGRGLINFMGHGNNTGFGFSNGFWYSSNYVRNLNNGDKLPWVIPLACNIGQFKGRTCVAEEWVRNPQGGAIVIMGSSPLMAWNPPQVSQVEMNRLVAREAHQSIGAYFFNGQMEMVDVVGEYKSKKTARTWNYFGDPSIQFFSAPPAEMQVDHDDVLADGENTTGVSAPAGATICFYSETAGIIARAEAGTGSTELSYSVSDEDTLLLTVTARNRVPYVAKLPVGDGDPYLTLESPADGETWYTEDVCPLVWSDNIESPVSLELFQGGESVGMIGEALGGSSLDWTVPADIPAGSDYSLVISADELDLADTLDGTFTIAPSQWSENLVTATEWGTAEDSYEDDHASTVTLQSLDTLKRADFSIGVTDESAEIYPWASVTAFLNGALTGVDAVHIIYRADGPVRMSLDQSGLIESGTCHGTGLPATAGEWVDTILYTDSDFAQPDWLSGADATPLDLDSVESLSFAPAETGGDVSLEMETLKLRNYCGECVSLLKNAVAHEGNDIRLTAVSAERISLAVPESGEYAVSLYDITGRVVSSDNIRLDQGVNMLPTGKNISRNIYILTIEGVNRRFVSRISLH